MRLTNNHGIIPALAACVMHDDYEKGDADYSVTELLSPARQQTLLRRHGNTLTEDVADRIYAFIGKIGHAVLEQAKVAGDVVEHRVGASVDGFRVSGKFDRLIQDDTLIDLKLMSVWEIIYGLKDEKVWQLNMYRWLAAQCGIRVDRLMIVGVLRDWSVGEAERKRRAGDGAYPQHQVVQIPVACKPFDQVLDFMRLRIAAHQRALNTPNWLPECTEDERWAKPTTYALMKPSRKSAARVMESEDELKQWAVDNAMADYMPAGTKTLVWTPRNGVYIEKRVGESVRCQRYCRALDVCTQGQKLFNPVDAPEATDAA